MPLWDTGHSYVRRKGRHLPGSFGGCVPCVIAACGCSECGFASRSGGRRRRASRALESALRGSDPKLLFALGAKKNEP